MQLLKQGNTNLWKIDIILHTLFSRYKIYNTFAFFSAFLNSSTFYSQKVLIMGQCLYKSQMIWFFQLILRKRKCLWIVKHVEILLPHTGTCFRILAFLAFRILSTAVLLWQSMYFGEKQQKQHSDTNGFPDWMHFVILNKQEVAVIKGKAIF